MEDLAEKENKPAGRMMIILACGLLFLTWLAFLYPWVRYQFWQSDTFWLIETGRMILAKHCLPAHDPFSFTSSASQWTVYQWLSEVVFALADDFDGLTGVAILGQIIVALLYCLLIFRRMLKDGTNALAGVVAIWLAAFGFYPDLAALRPQLFSFVLFWLLAMVCKDSKSGLPFWKAILQTFIIAVLWTNFHLSFPVGLVFLATHCTGTLYSYKRKPGGKKVPILMASMLATFVIATLFTPYGFSLWLLVGSVHNLYYSQEVQPLIWTDQPLLIVLAFATLTSCLCLRKKLDAADFFTLGALLITGCYCARLIVYFCIFSCPLIGEATTRFFRAWLSHGVPGRLSEAMKSVAQSRLYAFVLVLLAAWVVKSQPVYIPNKIPLEASKFLLDHPVAGNLFCSAHAGSYLIYSAHGTIPVFMDTRVDLYDVHLCNRFVDALINGNGWNELFSQYNIAAALLPNSCKLRVILDGQPAWKAIHRDQCFSLYVHNSSSQ